MKKIFFPFLFLISFYAFDSFSQQKAPTRKDIEDCLKKQNVIEASPGMDGATTVEIIDVQLGQPRKWQLNDGGSPLNGRNTSLWPVKVHYKYRTHYRSRTTVSERQWGYSIFKDAFNEWLLSVSSYPGQPKDKYSEEPSTMK